MDKPNTPTNLPIQTIHTVSEEEKQEVVDCLERICTLMKVWQWHPLTMEGYGPTTGKQMLFGFLIGQPEVCQSILADIAELSAAREAADTTMPAPGTLQ